MNKAKLITIIAVVLVAVIAISWVILLPPSSSDGENTPTNPSLQGEDVELPFNVYITDLNEYYTFLQTSKDLPNNFVTWDMIKSLGTFCTFRNYKDPKRKEYKYTFYVEGEQTLTFEVVPEYTGTTDLSPILSPKFGSSMAQLVSETKLTGLYESGEILYGYGENNLYSICWVVNDTRYEIWSANAYLYQLAGYDPETVLGKLLSVDPEVQLSALNELKAAIENN